MFTSKRGPPISERLTGLSEPLDLMLTAFTTASVQHSDGASAEFTDSTLTHYSSPKTSASRDEILTVVVEHLPDDVIIASANNVSLSQGKFISAFKHAKVVPIHKKGDVTNFNNYRSISLLPSFLKILKKIVYKRLHSFFSRFKLLSNTQFGFKTGNSTAHFNCLLVDKVTAAIEKKNVHSRHLSRSLKSLQHNSS